MRYEYSIIIQENAITKKVITHTIIAKHIFDFTCYVNEIKNELNGFIHDIDIPVATLGYDVCIKIYVNLTKLNDVGRGLYRIDPYIYVNFILDIIYNIYLKYRI